MKNIIYAIIAFMTVVFLAFALLTNKSPKKQTLPATTTPTPVATTPAPTQTTPLTSSAESRKNAGVPLTAGEVLTTDPQDKNPKLAAKEKAIAKKFALLQTLPYDKDGYHIEFKDVDKSNKVILEVRYPQSLAAAKSKYQQLLRQTRDSGSAYKVTYKHG